MRAAPREQAGRSARRRSDVPEATVARLPVYLRALHALAEAGRTTVTSEALAAAAGVGSAKLRKDLSHLGSYGTRGVGYDVARAGRPHQRRARPRPALVGRPRRRRQPRPRPRGLRRLRRPRLPHRRAARRRPGPGRRAGRRARRAPPRRPRPRSCATAGVSIGVIATPAAAAQDGLRPAGRGRRHEHPELRAGACCRCPHGVDVRKVDLSDRAADPVLPRAPQGRRLAEAPPREVSA